MKQTEEKKENRKKLILKTARRVFAKHGYFLTTIDMVAKAADLAKGTTYLYFKNKEYLFFSLVEDGYNELFSYLINIKNENVDPLRKIYNMIKLDVEFHGKNDDLCRLFFSNQAQVVDNFLPKFRQKILEKHMEQIKLVAEIVSEGIKQKKLKKMDPIQLAIVIIGITHCLNITNCMNISKQKSAESEISFMYDFVLNGCRKH
ncbi:MAG: TetR/AcrR family transcriptional regulator [bacterium]